MRGLFRRREAEEADDEARLLRLDAERGRALIRESREAVVVLGADELVVSASRRALESVEGLHVDERIPADAKQSARIPIEVDGVRETVVYLGEPGEPAAYEELRAGFTAAVSHELRTPLARLLVLLESATLPDSDPHELVERARAQVDQIRELIDDVLFLSELETGRQVVSLASTAVLPVLEQVRSGLDERAERAGIGLHVEGDAALEVPVRPRMLRVIAENLAENALRYAGTGARFVLSVRRENGAVVLRARDDGIGVVEHDLPRLFERFYRADRARASRGTGLGLAIVKHIVTSAGGRVEASGARGRGLEIRCIFPGRGSR